MLYFSADFFSFSKYKLSFKFFRVIKKEDQCYLNVYTLYRMNKRYVTNI